MNSKFYVSIEAAKLLKEKGFNKTVDKLIHLNQYKIPIIESPEKYYDESEVYNDYLYLKKSHYACPTKAEAIDWLESKGIVVVVYYCESAWQYLLYQLLNEIEDRLLKKVFIKETYPTRLEAEEAAIIKALKLLNGKEE